MIVSLGDPCRVGFQACVGRLPLRHYRDPSVFFRLGSVDSLDQGFCPFQGYCCGCDSHDPCFSPSADYGFDALAEQKPRPSLAWPEGGIVARSNPGPLGQGVVARVPPVHIPLEEGAKEDGHLVPASSRRLCSRRNKQEAGPVGDPCKILWEAQEANLSDRLHILAGSRTDNGDLRDGGPRAKGRRQCACRLLLAADHCIFAMALEMAGLELQQGRQDHHHACSGLSQRWTYCFDYQTQLRLPPSLQQLCFAATPHDDRT